ncbi:MAG: MBL fold metallo-hydrolase [Bacteroidia bacterium]|nr:MBL fold metallo-hydrolase [Bacteroidia bacterium]
MSSIQEPIRIILPNHFDGSTVNAWLFVEPEPILVDCGMLTEDSWNALVRGIRQNGLEMGDISKLIITHGHADHMGMANKVAEESQCEVWIPEYLLDWAIDLGTQLRQRDRIYRDVFNSHTDNDLYQLEDYSNMLLKVWEPISKDRLRVFDNDAVLKIGLHEWQTFYTPGHCINQVVFYQPEYQQLISGDMILNRTPVPYPDAGIGNDQVRCQSLRLLLNSYKTISKLKIQHVYPGHFEIMGCPEKLIQKQVNRIELNIQKCFAWIHEGIHDFETIIQKLYPKRINDSTFFMTIAILDFLVYEKKVESRIINKKSTYFPIRESVLSSTS